MSRGFFDHGFAELPRVLPVFPLPGVLLLPGGSLPLNVFEPRYLAMVRDAIAGERLIGMIQPREAGGGTSDVGAATIYDVGCAGRISAFSETPDGRYRISLAGLIRFQVAGELPLLSGYRRVIADYSRFRGDLDIDPAEIDLDRLLDTLDPYLRTVGVEADGQAMKKLGGEQLVISLAMLCPFAAPEKQALLEAVTLPERMETMAAIMRMAAHEFAPAGAPH